ncbi:MAG: putative transcriptional regulator, containd two HTH domain [Candidatus Methanohalarchaeum thermophilum]|uniref:Transcriptional regulator, containd two HTH domain n=1 Tax=Methanohalarchaeum thermophilum TaxID=1903181 RepID=A0A1Q6DV90_METT1|nr:MAG: putative transcriptional regulator, containd two HTH domain [Candidatus Methanohalarchaeum thermophilum]
MTDEIPSLLDLGSDMDDPAEELDECKYELENEDIDLNSLSNENRRLVIRNRIRRAIRKYGEDGGLTASEVQELTNISYNTVKKHLEELCNLREIYKKKRDKRTTLYYPNGKPLHSFEKKRIEAESGDSILEVQLAKGRNQKLFFHILEKRYSILEGEKTEGAIMFPLEKLDEFYSKLNNLAQEVEENE